MADEVQLLLVSFQFLAPLVLLHAVLRHTIVLHTIMVQLVPIVVVSPDGAMSASLHRLFRVIAVAIVVGGHIGLLGLVEAIILFFPIPIVPLALIVDD